MKLSFKLLSVIFLLLSNVSLSKNSDPCADLCRKYLLSSNEMTLNQLNEYFANLDFVKEFQTLNIDNQTYKNTAYEKGVASQLGSQFSLSFIYLKKINDTLDKTFSSGSKNLYMYLFLKNIQNNDTLKNIDSKYLDYKGLRGIATHEKSDKIETELISVFKETNSKFSEILTQNKEIKQLLSKSDLPDPSQWHSLGLANDADYTNLLSRLSRKKNDSQENANKDLYLTHEEGLRIAQIHKDELGQYEQIVYKELENYKKSGLFDSDDVLSYELFEILRKEKDLTTITKRIELRFGINLPAEYVSNLLKYYDKLDLFSPELILPVIPSIDYNSTGGLLSGDIVGMGALNAYYVAKNLKNQSQSDLHDFLISARRAELEATKSFNEKVSFIKNQLQSLQIIKDEKSFYFSGDDTVAHVVLSLKQRKERVIQLVKNVSSSKDFSQSFRIVDLPPGPVDRSSQHFTTQDSVKFITDMETVLKETTKKCEAMMLYQSCKQLTFSGQILPSSNNTMKLNLIVAGKNNGSLDLNTIRKFFSESIENSKSVFQSGYVVAEAEVVDVRN